VLQPLDAAGAPTGAERGLYLTAKDKHPTSIVSRNNLLWLRSVKGVAVFDPQQAAQLGVDPTRIAIGGGSAGAHLALMAAYTAEVEKPGHDRGAEPRGVRARLLWHHRCARVAGGIVRECDRRHSRVNGAVFSRVGSPVPPEVSPLAHVTAGSPPTLILHGRADRTVDYTQSVALADTLRAHGVPHDLLLLDGVGHTFDFEGWNQRPLPRDMRAEVLAFLARHLGPR
jgi:acetyl esterase/lipase